MYEVGINVLNDITQQSLSKLLTMMGNNQEIFTNESQFQFRLAWILREMLDDSVELELEHLVYNEDDCHPKMYIDIWLNDNDGEIIPIEL